MTNEEAIKALERQKDTSIKDDDCRNCGADMRENQKDTHCLTYSIPLPNGSEYKIKVDIS